MNSAEWTFSVISASMKRATWSSTARAVSVASGTALCVASAGTGVMTSGGVSWKLGTAAVAVAALVDAGVSGLAIGAVLQR